jgi:hypothetical protein
LNVTDLDDCDPIKTVGDLGNYMTVSGKNINDTVKGDGDIPANPCGLVAKSFFTDSYNLTKNNGVTNFTLNEKGIAWESDIKYKFKNLQDPPVPGTTWRDY